MMNMNDNMSIDSDIRLLDKYTKTYSQCRWVVVILLGFIFLQIIAIVILGHYTNKYVDESKSWDSCTRSMKQWSEAHACK